MPVLLCAIVLGDTSLMVMHQKVLNFDYMYNIPKVYVYLPTLNPRNVPRGVVILRANRIE